MKKQNGITLIALVISIIVMLILAGVSINAIVGENGVLSKAQYSSFMNEMAAVEEAVELWKAGELIDSKGETTTAIPANGLCKANDLTSTERLVGEIGYYRVWSIGETMPSINILSSAYDFNQAFSAEMVTYPAGVQDLYYLNNEALGLKDDKVYLIDASTSIVYSMTGISLNGVRCYSSHMAKAVMGNNTAPLFAEAEVSGTGSGEVLAGNVSSEYLYDENGNLLYNEDGTPKQNPDYNPNGFQILASAASNNIFKLYNNGDLYGKGIKGSQLNTKESEMDKINQYIWKNYEASINMSTIVKTIVGTKTIFYIDNDNNVYAFGDNTNNKLGLTEEQSKEYTGREAIKLNLPIVNSNIVNIYSTDVSTFITYANGDLYACGYNVNGELGIGNEINPLTFTKVENFNKADKIIQLESFSNGTLIQCSDGTFYMSGIDKFGILGVGSANTHFLVFNQVYDGKIGPDIDGDISMWSASEKMVIVKKDGTAYTIGWRGFYQDKIETGSNYEFKKITEISGCYKYIQGDNCVDCFLTKDNEGNTQCYFVGGSRKTCGTDFFCKYWTELVILPEDLKESGIKDVYCANSQYYFISNDGKLYGTGNYAYLGMNNSVGHTETIEYLNIDNVIDFGKDVFNFNMPNKCCFVFINTSEGLKTTASQSLMYGDDILQKSWTLVASNVKYFNPNACAYIDKAGDLYVCGNSIGLGLGDLSEANCIIPQYVKCEDSSIAGKCKKVIIVREAIYVLTIDDDLYAAGRYAANGGPDNTGNMPGWNDGENKYNFFLLLEDVSDMIGDESGAGYAVKLAIMKDGTARVWGGNYGCTVGTSTNLSNTPVSFNFPEKIGGNSNILKIVLPNAFRSFFITKNQKVYIGGTHSGTSNTGGNNVTNDFAEYTYGLDLNDGEYIVDIACQGTANAIFLTSEGRLFGYGSANAIGIGDGTTNYINNREIFNSDKIVQIAAGNGFFIAVTEDGKVYGTGSNQYGVLGRWSGVGRGESNSRYKTALNWVECPELEI